MKVPRWLVVVFWLFLAVVAGVIGYIAQDRLREERHNIEDNLQSVAELKVSQLGAWLQERLGDAEVLTTIPGLAETLTPWSAAPGSGSPQLAQVERCLETMLRNDSYREIVLLDRTLRPVRTYPANVVWDGVLSPRNREELLRGNPGGDQPLLPLIEDLHVDQAGHFSMHLLVRVRSAAGEFAGVAMLNIAAEKSLFPLVQGWPVETASAETLLVRRDGDSVLYLNPLRHRTGAALQLRLPLSNPDLLAAKALRVEQGGLVTGKDYRGVPVVGVSLRVPGTPWTMIAKIDQSEAYAQAWAEFWHLLVAMLLSLLVLVLLGRYWLHFRQSIHINRRLESEQKRRAAAERLAIVMRHASDVILLFDESQRIVDANDRAVDAYGYTPQELIKLTARDLRTMEASADLQRHFSASQEDKGFTFETIHQRKDGTTFPVEVSARPVMLEGRRHVLSIIRDITLQHQARAQLERFNLELERKVAQRTEELAARTEQMRALLEAIPDTVMRLRVDGSILASQPAQHGTGDLAAITPQVGIPTTLGASAELLAANMALGRRALQSGITVVEELELTTPNAKMFLEMRSSPTGADEFVAIIRDISERKRMENAMRETTLRLRLATHAGGVGVWEYYPPTKTLVWNDQMFSLYGVAREKFSGAYDAWQKGLHPDDRQRSEEELQIAIQGGKDFDTEFRVVWPDGNVRNIRAHAMIVRDSSGQTQQMLGTNWDITAQKQLEVETKAMLEKERQVSDMKTRFISLTSHEFRTPMTAAMGSVEMLANHFDQLAPPKRLELLGRVNTSLHRMTEMLDEVLLLNRMDAKRIEMSLAPTNMRQQLDSFIEEIRLGDRDAHAFHFHVSGEVDNFVTDLSMLHHIVSNLLSNAVRYSPAGSTITVLLEGGPAHLSLSVQDQGIGIPEKDRPRIFEAFERGSNVGNIKGTGLGLNIVKRMTGMLGGTIEFEPVAPTGSRFTLVLPRLPQPTPRP